MSILGDIAVGDAVVYIRGNGFPHGVRRTSANPQWTGVVLEVRGDSLCVEPHDEALQAYARSIRYAPHASWFLLDARSLRRYAPGLFNETDIEGV